MKAVHSLPFSLNFSHNCKSYLVELVTHQSDAIEVLMGKVVENRIAKLGKSLNLADFGCADKARMFIMKVCFLIPFAFYFKAYILLLLGLVEWLVCFLAWTWLG